MSTEKMICYQLKVYYNASMETHTPIKFVCGNLSERYITKEPSIKASNKYLSSQAIYQNA